LTEEFQYIDDVDVSHHCRAKTFDPETHTFTGPRCKKKIPAGQLVCFRHGNGSPRTRNKAMVRNAEAQARFQLKKRAEARGITRIQDIYEELEMNAAEAAAFRQICFDRVEALKDDWRYSSSAGEQLRAEVALYERAMDRANKFLMDMARLGIAEKRVKIAETQALLLVGVIQNVLGRLDLTRDQKRIAATVVPEELRAIAAPAEEDKT